MEFLLNILENKNKLLLAILTSELIFVVFYLIHPILALLPILAILGIVLYFNGLFKGPVFWIMVGVFASGLDIWGQIAGGVTLFHVAWLMSILTTIVILITTNDQRLKYIYPISKPFFVFIILALLSLIYSPNFNGGLYIIVQTLALYIFFIIVSNFINTKTHMLVILGILLLLNVSQTLLITYQLLFENVTYFADSTVETTEGFRIYRPSGTFHDPNVLATYMIFGVIYTVSYMIFNNISRILKLILIGFVLVSLSGIILTFSRSGWLALMFGMITILLFYPKKKVLLYWGLGIFSIFLLAAFIIPHSELVIERFTSITDLMKDPSIRVRLALIKSSFFMFFDHPFFGVGFRGYPMFYDFYLDPLAPQIQLYVKESHTLWSTLLAELSIWGVIVVAIFFYKFFKDSLIAAMKTTDNFKKSIYVGVFSIFIALNIDFLFYGFLFPQFNLFWLNFALFYALKDNFIYAKT